MASRLENLCPSVVQGSRNSSSTVAAPSLSLFLYGIEAWRLLSPSCNTLSYTPKNHPKTSYVYPLLNQDKKVGKSIILLYKIFYSQPKNKLPLHISNKNSKKNGSYFGINFRIIIGQIWPKLCFLQAACAPWSFVATTYYYSPPRRPLAPPSAAAASRGTTEAIARMAQYVLAALCAVTHSRKAV